MAFPDLDLQTGGVHHSSKQGIPVNGNNTFLHNIPNVSDPTWIDVTVTALGTSITNAVKGAITATEITINFTQTGTDSADVKAHLNHTIGR